MPVFALRRLGGVPLPDDIFKALGEPAYQRASRFADPADRDGFVAGRISLQQFAGSLLDVEPERLVPAYDCPQCGPGQDHGRPGFTLDGGPAPLALSASRASGWVLLAGVVHPPEGLRLGVDLETVARVDFDGFDNVALTENEQRYLLTVPDVQRAVERARLWARKEAWLKMTGEGLRHNPAEVDVQDLAGLSDLPGLSDLGGVDLPGGLVAAFALG
ncbi:4'-phosphopantetheinyl transferase superfamily protein [Arthrobacter sp. SIMBA_036]|uniref:4'-phosphopantetheinyl transferase family protein n=1 Tax=Arthrobacter sp. SIMBA_036 TaxID=3085778 RepID=UPI003979A28E